MRQIASYAAAGAGTTYVSATTYGKVNDSGLKDRRFYLACSATGGTPTFDVTIVVRIGSEEIVLGTFAQLTATGSESIVVANCPANVEVKAVIGGTTPSITAAVYVD